MKTLRRLGSLVRTAWCYAASVVNPFLFFRNYRGNDHWSKLPELSGVPMQERIRYGNECRPLYLKVETVNICNNLCVVCAYQDQARPKKVMPMHIFKKTVEDYVALGGGYLTLTPLVGEVLLDPHLINRLKHLELFSEKVVLGMTTNASMAFRYSDEELEYIVRRFSKISISVYGINPNEYKRMTKRKDYTRLVTGMRRIITMAVQPVAMEFRLLDKKSPEELFDWLKNDVMLGVDPNEWISKTRINSSITDYANWGRYNDNNNPLTGDAKWISFRKLGNRPQCLIPMLACIVLSNGNVSFCPCDNFDDDEELRLGNIMEHSLASMYNSPRAQELWQWKKYGTPEFCKNCSFHIPLSVLQENPSILSNPHQIVGAG